MQNRLETLLAHAGYDPDPQTGAVIPPINLATTFERVPGEDPRYVYTRATNPNREQFESLMARLEEGGDAMAFASGMAAISSVFQLFEPGDRVLLPDNLYYGVRKVLADVFSRWKLRYDYVDTTDLGAVEEALREPTRLLWLETPSNPLGHITDLRAISQLAHDKGAHVAVDGTFTTPLLQRPLELGADVVVHSVTKFLSGHSDVLAGVAVVKEGSELAGPLREIQQSYGAVLDPFSAWLAMRGMRTLAVRIRTQCLNARRIADFLSEHPQVAAVHYPGLPSHPGHDTARSQMDDFGGMLSFEMKDGAEAAKEVVRRCRVFRRATSLGGTESLIEHRASIEQLSAIPDSLIRVSTGIEHIDDLLDDLSQALREG